jgi:hypothetical protein
MEPVPDELLTHYGTIDEGSRITEGLGRLEPGRTQEMVLRYLPSSRCKVLDVGGRAGWCDPKGGSSPRRSPGLPPGSMDSPADTSSNRSSAKSSSVILEMVSIEIQAMIRVGSRRRTFTVPESFVKRRTRSGSTSSRYSESRASQLRCPNSPSDGTFPKHERRSPMQRES